MNAQMAAFFASLSDAVILVDGAGLVQHHNALGAALLQTRIGQPFPAPQVLAAIQAAAAGRSPPPLTLGVGDSALLARILPMPTSGILAVVVQRDGERQFYQMTMQNFYELLRLDLSQPIHRFVQGMAQRDDGDDELIAAGKSIAGRLERLEWLAELFGHAPLVDQERLCFEQMITEVLNAEGAALSARKIAVYLQGLSEELPPVYGSRPWLTRALRELVHNAACHATPETKLEIALRCSGAHVIVSLRNHGKFAGKALQQQRLFVPFNQAAQFVAQRAKGAKGAPAGGAGIGLPICQQIMRLHGGNLVVVEGSDDDLVEFNIELATGAPSRSTATLDVEQAQRYAHDMAALRQRLRAQAS